MDNELQTLRHTASHILAQAVKRLYPQAKLAIGPAIENGFYYDIDMPVSVTPEVLAQLEAEMKKITAENLHRALHPAARRGAGTDEGRAL